MLPKSDGQSIVEFLSTGKFKRYEILRSDTIFMLIGKWTLIKNSQVIKEYNISEVPNNLTYKFTEHIIPIINLTQDELVTEEYTNTETGPDEVYYKRLK